MFPQSLLLPSSRYYSFPTQLSLTTCYNVTYPVLRSVKYKYYQVDEDGKITDAKFKTFGCGSAIASSSLATEWVKGKHLDEAAGIKNSDIAKVSPV